MTRVEGIDDWRTDMRNAYLAGDLDTWAATFDARVLAACGETPAIGGITPTYIWANPNFLKDDVHFTQGLADCAAAGGAAVVYLDEQDYWGVGDPANSDFHYALLNFKGEIPADEGDYEDMEGEIPLPILAYSLGMVAIKDDPDDEHLQPVVNVGLADMATFLNNMFNGQVFIASRRPTNHHNNGQFGEVVPFNEQTVRALGRLMTGSVNGFSAQTIDEGLDILRAQPSLVMAAQPNVDQGLPGIRQLTLFDN